METDQRNKNEIWICDSHVKDFKVELEHLPRSGDIFEIEGKSYQVKGVKFIPSSTEYATVNKCIIHIVV